MQILTAQFTLEKGREAIEVSPEGPSQIDGFLVYLSVGIVGTHFPTVHAIRAGIQAALLPREGIPGGKIAGLPLKLRIGPGSRVAVVLEGRVEGPIDGVATFVIHEEVMRPEPSGFALQLVPQYRR
jgi:hypothetical protein